MEEDLKIISNESFSLFSKQLGSKYHNPILSNASMFDISFLEEDFEISDEKMKKECFIAIRKYLKKLEKFDIFDLNGLSHFGKYFRSSIKKKYFTFSILKTNLSDKKQFEKDMIFLFGDNIEISDILNCSSGFCWRYDEDKMLLCIDRNVSDKALKYGIIHLLEVLREEQILNVLSSST